MYWKFLYGIFFGRLKRSITPAFVSRMHILDCHFFRRKSKTTGDVFIPFVGIVSVPVANAAVERAPIDNIDLFHFGSCLPLPRLNEIGLGCFLDHSEEIL